VRNIRLSRRRATVATDTVEACPAFPSSRCGEDDHAGSDQLRIAAVTAIEAARGSTGPGSAHDDLVGVTRVHRDDTAARRASSAAAAGLCAEAVEEAYGATGASAPDDLDVEFRDTVGDREGEASR